MADHRQVRGRKREVSFYQVLGGNWGGVFWTEVLWRRQRVWGVAVSRWLQAGAGALLLLE